MKTTITYGTVTWTFVHIESFNICRITRDGKRGRLTMDKDAMRIGDPAAYVRAFEDGLRYGRT